MEASAPMIEFAAYEKRLWSISTQLDPRERSLVLRFAQDLLMLGTELQTELHSAPNCPTIENHREPRLPLQREDDSDQDATADFDPGIGYDVDGDDTLSGRRLLNQPH
jgi:hypothetical protein